MDQFATHLGILRKAAVWVCKHREGRILELGCGHWSTMFLQGIVTGLDGKLLSLEEEMVWIYKFAGIGTELHEIRRPWLPWSSEPSIDEAWDLVFVDHASEERLREIERVKDSSFLVVVHDTEPKVQEAYHFDLEWKSFKSHWTDDTHSPFTTICSNFVDVGEIVN